MSSAVWKNEIFGARDFVLAASAIRKSNGSRDEAGSGVCGSVHRKGYFWERILARHCIQRRSRRTCATVPQPSELRFGVVRAVGRGIAVLDGGQRNLTGRGGFREFCSPLSQWEMPLRRRR